jgi:hypothetical protein
MAVLFPDFKKPLPLVVDQDGSLRQLACLLVLMRLSAALKQATTFGGGT